jgi:putative nucleotidyltransferase with HDIG domain
MGMLDNIVSHSIQVCRVALLIVDRLEQPGGRLNRSLVQAAALLHDITKTRSFSTGEMHTETGGRLLEDLGYGEVGDIVRQHVKLDRYFDSFRVTEAEVVNYADKRVLHDRIVSLTDRMDYIMRRYAHNANDRHRVQWLVEKSIASESRIFSAISFSPEDVAAYLNARGLRAEMAVFRQASKDAGDAMAPEET